MRAILLATVAFLAAIPAQAAVINGSYTGVVSTYYTSRPFFTASASDVLTGMLVSGTFQYDTSQPGSFFNNAPSSLMSGGGSFIPTSTGISYTGTINGHTTANSSTSLSYVVSYPETPAFGGFSATPSKFELQAVYRPDFYSSESLFLSAYGPFTQGLFPVTDETTNQGSGRLIIYDDVLGGTDSSAPFTSADFTITSLTIYGQPATQEPAQPVPEPAGIAMLGIGLTALWRARRGGKGAAA